MSSPTKEVNHATLCRFGQETVHDILQKTQDLFAILKQASMASNIFSNRQLWHVFISKLTVKISNNSKVSF